MINIGFDTNTAIEQFIVDIKDKNDNIKARYALDEKDIEKNVLMTEHYIQISFSLDEYLSFKRSDYIIIEGEKYILKNDYLPEEINSYNYRYTLRFDHWTTFLKDATFYYLSLDLKEAEWSITTNAATMFQLIADNTNRYFGINTFNIGTIEFTDIKFLQFSKINVWDAATQIAEAYGGEWYLTGTTFHLVKKFSYGSEINFQNDISISKIRRSEGVNSERYTRILALGSTRNIPTNYRETTEGEAVDAIAQKRLRIPIEMGDVIDAYPDMSPEEVKEGVVIFEDVYPKRIGTMSDITTVEYTDTNSETGEVTKWNAYRYKDSGLAFSKDYLLPNMQLRIAFQSGVLNGTSYDVKFNPLNKDESDPDSQIFEIIRNEDYGRPLPNDILKPQNGDTYILYGFNIDLVSDQYVPEAEQELYDKAVQWQQDQLKDKSVYDCDALPDYFEANEMDLSIGQKVKLIHSQFEGGYRSSRIQGYEKSLTNRYKATYTVGDNAQAIWAKGIEESIKELQVAGIDQQAVGNNGVYLIKQFDSTNPTDFNAYSAKASNARYLNKQTGGVVQGDTTFQQDVSAQGQFIGNMFGNETFTSGQFGSGFRAWVAENGQSYAEFDNILARREFIVNTLTAAEIKSVGGQILLSLADMVASDITDGGSYWKVSFNSDNGTIPNNFAIDDQVIYRKFNSTNIKYYWARVTSVGADYINISKTDKDGSGIPAIGDEIIQFGNRTNTARQSAILLSAYGSDAPSIKQYAGINSYDLTGREVTVISPSGNKFKGDFTIQSSGKSVTTAIDDAVDAIQIGGNNLLFNSNFNSGFQNWVVNSSATESATILDDSRFGKVAKIVARWTNGGIYQSIGTRRTSGKSYVISGYIKADAPMKVKFQHEGGTGTKEFNITTEWQRYETVGIWNSGGAMSFYSSEGGIFYLANLQYEEGNKSSAWNLSREEINAQIKAADDKAILAQNNATNAQLSADNANSLLSDIANDNLLTPSEKQNVLKEWIIIQGEYNTVISQAATYSVSSTDYTAKYNALNSYVSPLLSNMTTNSAIVGNTFRNNFKFYYDAKITLLKAVTDKSKQLADNAQQSANNANSELANKVAYSEYSTQIKAINTSINLKANQSDFNSLGQQVSNNTAEIEVQAEQISNVVTSVSNVDIKSQQAINDASLAQSTANNAQNTANNKNRTYYQDAIPTVSSGGHKIGDLWYMESLVDIDGNINTNSSKNVYQLQRRWNGTEWIRINWSVSQTKIIQTDSNINLLTEKTGINNLGTGETLKSLIDLTPEKIELAVGKIKIGGVNLLIRNGELANMMVGNDGSISAYANSNVSTHPISVRGGEEITFTKTDSSLADNAWRYKYVDSSGVLISRRASPSYEFIDTVPQGATQLIASYPRDSKVMIARGNKATSWSPSVEDTNASISLAQTTANNAQNTANTAQTNANEAKALYNDISNDDKLTPNEKQSVKKDWDNIVSEYSKNITEANKFSVLTAAYTTAYNTLNSYISPLLSNMTVTSNIVGTTFRTNFNTYHSALIDLLNSISSKAKEIADSKTTINEVKAGIKINADGITAFGNTFKVDSTLIANAIETDELSVGDGNFRVGADGKIEAKGAKIEGNLRLLWNGDDKDTDVVAVVDATQTPERTKVLITPQNIRSLNNITGNQTNYFVVAGGSSAIDTVSNQTEVFNSPNFTLTSGRLYDIQIPAIRLNAKINGDASRDATYAWYTMYIENVNTLNRRTITYGSVSLNYPEVTSNKSFSIVGVNSGTYRLGIEIFAMTNAFGSGEASYNIPSRAQITVRPIDDAIEIGKDGIMGMFSSSRYFHLSTNGFYVRMDNIGFRVTSSGVQKSSNMGIPSPTWTTL